LITCTRANPKLIHLFHEFGYLDLVYPDKNLTKLSYFPEEKKNGFRSFYQKPIFVKFHTILLEKDEAIGIHYPAINLIEVGYISENFELNIEPTHKCSPFQFNESWIKYRRTISAFAVKC